MKLVLRIIVSRLVKHEKLVKGSKQKHCMISSRKINITHICIWLYRHCSIFTIFIFHPNIISSVFEGHRFRNRLRLRRVYFTFYNTNSTELECYFGINIKYAIVLVNTMKYIVSQNVFT